MSEYTQGVCMDGAAILKDGEMMTIEEILDGLREIATARQEATAYRISLENLEASLPKIKAEAVSNYLEYLEYCKNVSIDNPTEPLEYLAGLNKLEAGE